MNRRNIQWAIFDDCAHSDPRDSSLSGVNHGTWMSHQLNAISQLQTTQQATVYDRQRMHFHYDIGKIITAMMASKDEATDRLLGRETTQ